MSDAAIEKGEQVDAPCCDWRDHGSSGCLCPDHPLSEIHPFGWPVEEGETNE